MLTRIRNAFLLYRAALGDSRTPLKAKVLPLLSLLYLVWPLDILPDLIPIVGQLDDIAVIVALFMMALRMIPDTVKNDLKRNVIDIEPKESEK